MALHTPEKHIYRTRRFKSPGELFFRELFCVKNGQNNSPRRYIDIFLYRCKKPIFTPNFCPWWPRGELYRCGELNRRVRYVCTFVMRNHRYYYNLKDITHDYKKSL